MTDPVFYSTQECAQKLNLAYGWNAMSRQRILYEIRSGRLPCREIPAAGSRERAMVKIHRPEFLAYCSVYHPDIRTAIKAICNN
jgi:hypothetical protein